MEEENQTGLGKIVASEFAYLLLVMVLAALSCLVQFLGRSYSHHSSGFLGGDIYSYNIIMYIVGAVLFITGTYVLYRVVFSKHADELAGFSAGYSVAVWTISLVPAFIMWWELIVVYFLVFGFGGIDTESLMWITAIGWPVYMTGLLGVMLIRCKWKHIGTLR